MPYLGKVAEAMPEMVSVFIWAVVVIVGGPVSLLSLDLSTQNRQAVERMEHGNTPWLGVYKIIESVFAILG